MKRWNKIAAADLGAPITEQDVISALKSYARAVEAKLHIKDGAVRLTSYEDDLCQFATIKDLIPVGISREEFLEDPMDHIEFTDTIGIHHHFDVSSYVADKRRLNCKYFPSTYKLEDTTWMAEGVQFTKSTHPGVIFKIVRAPINEDGYVRYVKTKANGQFSDNVIWVQAQELAKLKRRGSLQLV